MRYADLQLSENDALILEGLLVKAFDDARSKGHASVDMLRSMLARVRKTGLLDKEPTGYQRTLLSSPPVRRPLVNR